MNQNGAAAHSCAIVTRVKSSQVNADQPGDHVRTPNATRAATTATTARTIKVRRCDADT